MKFKLFSVVTGTEACVAACPFCVSGEMPCEKNMTPPTVNWRNFDIGCNLANRSGIDTVMLTSRGEPTLFPEQITEYLEHLKPHGFPFIELQSNMISVARNKEKYKPFLQKWYDLGLTTITISTASYDNEINRQVYQPNHKDYIDLPELIKFLHSFGFSLRLTCVCCKGWMDTTEHVEKYIQFAKDNKVEQVTLRPVNEEFRRESAQLWIKKRLLSDEDKQNIRSYLDENGTALLNLERIGTVYDVKGQNVMFSVPLTMHTRDTNPENGRQLIFFPDGHLRYEWEKEGGILL